MSFNFSIVYEWTHIWAVTGVDILKLIQVVEQGHSPAFSFLPLLLENDKEVHHTVYESLQDIYGVVDVNNPVEGGIVPLQVGYLLNHDEHSAEEGYYGEEYKEELCLSPLLFIHLNIFGYNFSHCFLHHEQHEAHKHQPGEYKYS